MDIHLERGNANKIMNRILALALSYNLKISQIDGEKPKKCYSKRICS